jgi:hypothetical protein
MIWPGFRCDIAVITTALIGIMQTRACGQGLCEALRVTWLLTAIIHRPAGHPTNPKF